MSDADVDVEAGASRPARESSASTSSSTSLTPALPQPIIPVTETPDSDQDSDSSQVKRTERVVVMAMSPKRAEMEAKEKLIQQQSRLQSKRSISNLSTRPLPSPSIHSTDADEDVVASEPLLSSDTSWKNDAAMAVDRYNRHGEAMIVRWPWNAITLTFQDAEAEQAFRFFFAELNEFKMRRRLLLLNFAYMIYATVEWSTRSYSSEKQNTLTAIRGMYVLLNLGAFTLSYSARQFYRNHTNLFSTVLSLLTSLVIMMEGFLLHRFYSPFVILLLIMYLIASHVYVRTRFIWSTYIVWMNLLMYDIIAVAAARDGDGDTAKDRGDVGKYLFWYNLILTFFNICIMSMTKRVEMQSRYAFINYFTLYTEQGHQHSQKQHGPRLSGSPEKDAFALSRARTEQPSILASLAASHGEKDLFEAKHDTEDISEEEQRRQRAAMDILSYINKHDGTEDPLFLRQFMSTFVPASMRGHGIIQHAHDPINGIIRVIRSQGQNNIPEYVRSLAIATHEAPPRVAHMCPIHDLPQWYISYPFIQTGYRVDYTAKQCIKSMFQIHNETINIWTEFIPMIVFLIGWIMIERLDLVLEQSSRVDHVMVSIALGALLVLRPLCSGLAHTFYCMSQRAFVICWGLDYASILVSVLCASLVVGRFTFYCESSQQTFFYVSVGGLFLSTVTTVLFVASEPIRTSSFLVYVMFSSGVPLIYQLVAKYSTSLHRTDQDVPEQYLILWGVSTGLAALGMLIKSSMIPERWFPGKFDLAANSHQIWHILINGANVISYFAFRSYLGWRAVNACPVLSN